MFDTRPRASLVALLPIAAILLILHATPLSAQAGSRGAMALPSEVLTAYLSGDVDRVWESANPTLRGMWGSPAGLREGMTEIASMMGAETGRLSEQVFDHPEGGGWQVYLRGSQHTQVPEIFWIVIFSPTNQNIQMIMPQPRQTIRSLFPAATLP